MLISSKFHELILGRVPKASHEMSSWCENFQLHNDEYRQYKAISSSYISSQR